LIKDILVSDEKEVIGWLMWALSIFFGGWFMVDRKNIHESSKEIDKRLRDVEQSSVGERYVRRMIEDVVAPIKVGQIGLKESQNETKGDVKELLRIIRADTRFRV